MMAKPRYGQDDLAVASGQPLVSATPMALREALLLRALQGQVPNASMCLIASVRYRNMLMKGVPLSGAEGFIPLRADAAKE
jgi:hypothetical protein